jgi:hypothetical protein
MKKNNFSFLGILAMVLALGLGFAGCDTDGGAEWDGSKSIKVMGINKPGIQAYDAEVHIIANDENLPQHGQVAKGIGDIDNQTLSVALYSWTADGGTNKQQPWKGNGEWTIRLYLKDSDNVHYYDYFWKNGQKYDIENAVTTLNFADFNLVYTGEH